VVGVEVAGPTLAFSATCIFAYMQFKELPHFSRSNSRPRRRLSRHGNAMKQAAQLRVLRGRVPHIRHGRLRTAPGVPRPPPHPSRPSLISWPNQARLSSTSTSSIPRPPPTVAVPVPSAAANPPYTTRPPPLALPVRGPDTSTFSHLFATGKAYVGFYKTGLKYLYVNTRLLHGREPATTGTGADAPPARPSPDSRAYAQLRRRWDHDIRRLPVFGLLLLLCGEFTPLAVLLLPRAVPLTCRIPRQVDGLYRRAEARRAAALAGPAPAVGTGAAAVRVARSLGVVGALWDRAGGVPAVLARRRVAAELARLAADDALLLRAGGAAALGADEVRLACAERGVDVLGRGDEELRRALALWLLRTRGGEAEDSVRRMEALLLIKDAEWK